LTPTTRCAAVLAALAVVALVLPLWLTALAAGILLAATLADGLSVRSAPVIERDLSATVVRGIPSPFAVRAVAGDSRRVLLRQPATGALRVDAEAGPHELGGKIVGLRRGRHLLPGVSAASLGPLGLARWQHPPGAPLELLVYPDLPGARRLALRLRQGRAAPDGRLRRGPLGLGTDFESLRDYSPDDDIRHVNWRATARLGRPMSNQYRVDQDRDVVFLIDCGRLMAAPASEGAAGTLLDGALDAAIAVAMAADELGDHSGAIAFDGQVRRVVEPRRLGGRRLVRALFDLEPSDQDSDFERAVLRMRGARRTLVFVFTDLIDEQAARSLLDAAPVLARRHSVVVAGGEDPSLDALAAPAAPSAEAVAALSVLQARERTALQIARTGAQLVLAPTRSLPQRCVQAYLRAKARARL